MSLQSAVLCVLSQWRGALRDSTKNGCVGDKGLLSLRTGGTPHQRLVRWRIEAVVSTWKKNSPPSPPPPPTSPYKRTEQWNSCQWCTNKSCGGCTLLIYNLSCEWKRSRDWKRSGSHSEVSWKTMSVFLSNCTMELVLGRSLDPLYCTSM